MQKRATKLIPLTEWPQHHAWPSVAALRDKVFFRTENGFDKVAKKASGRWLIDEEAFFEWVEDRNKKEGRHGR